LKETKGSFMVFYVLAIFAFFGGVVWIGEFFSAHKMRFLSFPISNVAYQQLFKGQSDIVTKKRAEQKKRKEAKKGN
jgi:hypothetical protein